MAGTCNPASGTCSNPNAVDNTSCNDGNACTRSDTCQAGACVGANPVTCAASDQCHVAGTCNPANGTCSNPNAADNTACNDGNRCTQSDTCHGGACVGANPVTCSASDQCHVAGICNPGTGACSNPAKPDGTTCNDGNAATFNDNCQSGICAGTNCHATPDPKSSGYYQNLCEKWEHNQLPYHGDTLTDADAACVGNLTETFQGISHIADICTILDGDGHHSPHGDGGAEGKECDKGENELMALALNICRQRVCLDQPIDSTCDHDSHVHTLTTVGASLATSDAILASSTRDKDTCKDAKCLAREINDKKALRQHHHRVDKDFDARGVVHPDRVRLSWLPPMMDDGSGTPTSYRIWRRPLNSGGAFVSIGTVNGDTLTFLDTTVGTGQWEYEVTVLLP